MDDVSESQGKDATALRKASYLRRNQSEDLSEETRRDHPMRDSANNKFIPTIAAFCYRLPGGEARQTNDSA
jgi:hypothetical protein